MNLAKFNPHIRIAVTILSLAFLSTGCAVNIKRTEITKDLTKIAEYQDCPTICEALKIYLKTKFGVSLPEDGASSEDMRVGAEEARLAHNQQAEGSNPLPAK